MSTIWTTQILPALQQALVTILLAAITLCAALGVAFINALKQKALAAISQIESDEKRKLLEDATNKALSAVSSVVMSIEQEEKQEILKAIEDGKLDRDELFKLKDVAFDRVEKQLLPETREILKENVGDVTQYLMDLISQQVLLIKNSN